MRARSVLRRGDGVAAGILALSFAAACAPPPPAMPGPALTQAAPIDTRATPETRALFANLRALARTHVLFGHHDDLAYGVGWRDQPGRSDVKESSGSYPAVYGWDLGHIELTSPENLDRNGFTKIRGWIAEAYARGGVNTLSWHLDNPVSGGNAWDTTAAVVRIVPGGGENAKFRGWLDRVADFVRSLHGPRGEPIPVVFRPYHEMSGSWFWWGGRHASPEEYVRLWRYTVSYLRDTAGVHNVLYAWSPDATDSRAEYMARYPGDAWVDVLGLDDYQSVKSPATRDVFVRRLRTVVEEAEARRKIPALTETGLVTIPDSTWWTGTLLAGIRSDSVARRIAWVLVWRNANRESDRPDHFYAPYAGHPSAADFRRFRDDPLVLFEDELPDLYRPGAPPRAVNRTTGSKP